MRKFILQTFGFLFLLTGFLTMVFSLLDQSRFFLSATLYGFDVGSFIYGLLTFSTGYNLLRLNSFGRILGIISLTPYMIVFSILSIFMGYQVLIGDAKKMQYIIFLGTKYGMSRDYSVTDPLITVGIYFVSAFITGLIIWFFISKDTILLFRNKKIDT